MILIGVDKVGCVSEWNAAAEGMSGFNCDEVYDCDFVNVLLTMDTRVHVSDAMRKAWVGDNVRGLGLPFYTKSGRRKELIMSLNACSPEKMVFIGFEADVKEDLPIEDTGASMRICVDTTGIITSWDDQEANLLGFSPEELHGCSLVDDFLSDEVRAFARQKIMQAIKGESLPNFALPIYSKTKSPKCFNVQIHPHRIDEQIAGAILVLATQVVSNACRLQSDKGKHDEETTNPRQPADFPSYDSLTTYIHSEPWSLDSLTDFNG